MRAAAPRPWGWHPLANRWAERIVAAAGVRPGDLVLDIGAGAGALTAPLVRAGARVIAIELHPGRADLLRRRFRDDPVSIVEADAAHELQLPHRPFRVVANPPYGISTALLRTLTRRGSRLARADLVVQLGFGRGFVQRSRPGPWQAWVDREVPRRAFARPPRVDSAVLVVTRRARADRP